MTNENSNEEEKHKLYLVSVIRDCKKRALKKNLKFNLTEKFIIGLYENQNGRCGLTNIDFDLTQKDSSNRKPFAPSLDRRDRTKGYTKDNIQLVLTAVNMALFTWGVHVFDEIVINRYETMRGLNLDCNCQACDYHRNRTNFISDDMTMVQSNIIREYRLSAEWFRGRIKYKLIVPEPFERKVFKGPNRETVRCKYFRKDVVDFFATYKDTMGWNLKDHLEYLYKTNVT